MSKKFLTIVGNRPQLIKLDKKLKQVICYTGQHYDKNLKDVFFTGLDLPKPDYDLGETTLGNITDKIIEIIHKEKPQYMIVYGDTRSTLAGAMAALYTNTPLIHIEAGCRSFNEKMVEERIRTIVDEIAIIHFAPSQNCKEYLERDNKKVTVYNVGATQIDSMFEYAFPTKQPKKSYKYIVATIHRDSNMEKERLQAIMAGLSLSNLPVRLYLHPKTRKFLDIYGIEKPENIVVLDPIPYKEMINEVAFANKIVTDSGGLQVEAFFLKVQCITLRNETEWPETIEQGWNRLIKPENLGDAINKEFPRGKGDWEVYGKGTAKERIRIILENL